MLVVLFLFLDEHVADWALSWSLLMLSARR